LQCRISLETLAAHAAQELLMPRPFTPAQQTENAAFLHALAGTGNARLAARALGVHRSTYTKRRRKDPAFAAGWNEALAAFHRAGAESLPAAPPALPDPAAPPALAETAPPPLRTKGGEPYIVRLKSGRLQLRRALPGQMTDAAQAHFLARLGASANLRLSAAEAGFAHSSFHRRRRRCPGFARAVEDNLDIACERLRSAIFQSFDLLAGPQVGETEEEWLDRVADCPLPPMTVEEALTMLRHHGR
jgi:hypothetical protein